MRPAMPHSRTQLVLSTPGIDAQNALLGSAGQIAFPVPPGQITYMAGASCGICSQGRSSTLVTSGVSSGGASSQSYPSHRLFEEQPLKEYVIVQPDPDRRAFVEQQRVNGAADNFGGVI